jgi:hypothetical protein
MEIEDEEYLDAVMDVKLELVSGFLINGPDHPERRESLFLALLKNIGLSRAVELVGRERWEEALRLAPGPRPG